MIIITISNIALYTFDLRIRGNVSVNRLSIMTKRLLFRTCQGTLRLILIRATSPSHCWPNKTSARVSRSVGQIASNNTLWIHLSLIHQEMWAEFGTFVTYCMFNLLSLWITSSIGDLNGGKDDSVGGVLHGGGGRGRLTGVGSV